MYTPMTVNVGPGTTRRLKEIAEQEGIDPQSVLDQAVAMWVQLDGKEERDTAGFVLMKIVCNRKYSQSKAA